MKQTMTNLKQLIRAGRGIIPAHTVIVNGNLVNVMSSEIYKADVAIYEDTIVAVGNITDYIGPDTKTIDAEGRYLVPGLIDGHIHSECSKLSITSYAKAVVPRGTTSMISGLDEYISVSGLEGLQEVFEEIKASPLKVFWGAPYKTPYTFPQSTVAFNFTKEVHEQVQQWPECYGVWETVREYVTEEDENTLGAIEVAAKNRLPVFGCAPMARGKELNGYLCAGIRLDHESYDHEEVVEKMRNGMHMLIRESSVTHFLKENIRAVTEVNPALARRVSFCTDDVTASDVLEKGHLDNVVRLAINEGVEPMTAIQMASLNAAECYGLEDRGAIAPGLRADIVLFDNLKDFNVDNVLIDGKEVAQGGQYKLPISLHDISDTKGSFHVKDFSKEKLRLPINSNKAYAINILPGGVVTSKEVVTINRDENNEFVYESDKDVVKVAVVERHENTGNVTVALLRGYGIKEGAIALSIAHDSHNIIVVGVNDHDMAFAVEELIKQGGGIVLVKDEKVLESMPMPIGGLMSDQRGEWVDKKLKSIHKIAHEILNVSETVEPVMTLCFMSLAVIPELKLTDMGLFDVTQFKFIPIEADLED